jgi:hypothetical protein
MPLRPRKRHLDPAPTGNLTPVPGRVVAGHGVAGSASPTSPYPAGTISLQLPFFLERGLDLSVYHPATLNVSTNPVEIRIVRPRHHFADVVWTDLHAPESFDFVVATVVAEGRRFGGWGYRPTTETKAGHRQAATVLEVIGPFIPGIEYGGAVVLELDPAEVTLIEPSGGA